jgi:hypothetical protein
MWVMGLLATAVMMAVTPWVIWICLGRLPYAPDCPRCHAVTAQAASHGLLDRACALVDATPVRTCTRCGWAGRMRWRLAHERAPGRR